MLWIPCAAHGQPADPQARFIAAQARFDQGEFAQALELFDALLKDTNSPNARLYLARSLRELGRLTEAYDQLESTVREAGTRAEKEPKYAQTRNSAAAELAVLGRRVGHLVVVPPAESSGSTISLQGSALSQDKLGRPVTVFPGRQVIELRHSDGRSERKEVDVPAGETRSVALSGAPQAPAKVEREPENAPPPPASVGGELRWAGIAVGALGVASLGAFAGTLVLANQKYDEVNAACGGVRCTDPAFADGIDEGKTLEKAALATAIVGGALVVASVPMIVFGGPREAEARATVKLTPGAVIVVGRF